jgi:hypothetical protein
MGAAKGAHSSYKDQGCSRNGDQTEEEWWYHRGRAEETLRSHEGALGGKETQEFLNRGFSPLAVEARPGEFLPTFAAQGSAILGELSSLSTRDTSILNCFRDAPRETRSTGPSALDLFEV